MAPKRSGRGRGKAKSFLDKRLKPKNIGELQRDEKVAQGRSKNSKAPRLKRYRNEEKGFGQHSCWKERQDLIRWKEHDLDKTRWLVKESNIIMPPEWKNRSWTIGKKTIEKKITSSTIDFEKHPYKEGLNRYVRKSTTKRTSLLWAYGKHLKTWGEILPLTKTIACLRSTKRWNLLSSRG